MKTSRDKNARHEPYWVGGEESLLCDPGSEDKSTHVFVLTRSSALIFDSFRVGTIFVSTLICRPIYAGSTVQTTSTHSYSTFSKNTAVVLAVEILRAYSCIRDDTYSSSTDSSDACSSCYIFSTYSVPVYEVSTISDLFGIIVVFIQKTDVYQLYIPLCNRAHSE